MKKRRTVAIVTDFGVDSFYVGVMKSVIHNAAPDAVVVDVTHSVEPHAVSQASFILSLVFEHFPDDTVFLAVVDPGVGSSRPNLVVETRGRRIVGPDNGLVSESLARGDEYRAYAIDASALDPYRIRPPVGSTFLGRDVFAPAAAALASGVNPKDFARPVDEVSRIEIPAVEVEPGRVSGRARYVDSFGNILTGISGTHLRRAFGDSPTGVVCARVGPDDLGPVRDYYDQARPGALLVIRNSWGVLEVSVTQGRAVDKFGKKPWEDLTVELRLEKG